MDSGMDLILARRSARQSLIDCVSAMKNEGRKLAEAEKNYRVALCQKILTEREKGTPVTIISDVCRGDPDVAELKFTRDLRESDYKVVQEKINQVKLEIRILDGEITAERNGQ